MKYPVFKNILICLILITALIQITPAQGNKPFYSKIRIMIQDKSDIRDLQGAGLTLEGMKIEERSVEVILNESEIMQLRELGYSYQVLIDDMTKFYLERSSRSETEMESLENKMKEKYSCSGFGFGSMGGYYTYAEVAAELDSMRLLYPGLISAKDSVGCTLEGRTIWAVKISDNPDINEGEPQVFYNSLTHAREPEGMMSVIYFMYYLLENYGSDPEITYLVDNREMYFIPVINPDGYFFNEQNDPGGGGMWRKNRRDNGNGCFGVDINTNYGYMWGYNDIGSSPDPCNEAYRGPFAFSEPENQCIRDFCNEHNFIIACNFHTPWDVVFTSWGYNLTQTSDSLIYNNTINLATQFNNYDNWINYDGSYEANGDVCDWMYGEQITKPVIYAYLPEVGSWDDGFWPAPERIFPIAQENCYLNKVLAWGPGVIDNPPNIFFAGTNSIYYTPLLDTINITALQSNPDNLADIVTAGMHKWDDAVIDNYALTNSDSNLYSVSIPAPEEENYYYFIIKDSCSQPPSKFYYKKNLVFTTAGPVVLDSIMYIKNASWINLKPFVSNLGNSLTITNAKLKFLCNDPWVASVSQIPMTIPPIDPGSTVAGGSWAVVSVIDSLFPGYFNLKVQIMKDGYTFWTDSIQLFIIPVKVNDNLSLQSFNLEQNYPNPFNPSTSIQYAVGSRQFVSLKVYDVLGREVATLVNEYKSAGRYSVEFTVKNEQLSSGVYFYRLTAGSYSAVKKMVLLK